MIQVIKREFEKIDELVKYINNTSISYGHLKDYQIMRENNKCIVLLNFDIPSAVCQFLELARFDIVRDKSHLIYRMTYKIEPEEKNKDSWTSMIYFDDLRCGVQIQGIFGFKSTYSLATVTYDKFTDYFTVQLRNFDFERSMIGWHTDIEETLFVKDINHEIIYNHVVKLLLNRGYLIDTISLKEFKDHVYYLTKWLNKKNFNEDK
ncbi:hypothetical protein [Clostridium uliginosum]|nr:hypothetical protein [Clostridium uliginosum]